MQIDDIRYLNMVNAMDSSAKTGQVNEFASAEKTKESHSFQAQGLRQINIKNPTYQKNTDLLEDLDENEDQQTKQTAMIFAASGMTEDTMSQTEDKGWDPCDTEANTLVTVSDQIKEKLARAGVDISMMGGLSDAVVEKMGGSSISVNTIKAELEGQDLPADKEILSDTAVALAKAGEVQEVFAKNDGRMPEEMEGYLVSNELEPTIANFYQAAFATGSSVNQASAEGTLPLTGGTETLQQQFANVITAAGLEVNDETLADCQWLMGKNIPVTPDNIDYLNRLQQADFDLTDEDVANAIVTSVSEGKMPQQAYLMPGYSLKDQAIRVYDEYQNATVETVMTKEPELDSVTAQRQLAEVQLKMTVEANYSMLKQGIRIDTEPLQQLIEDLKNQESLSTEVAEKLDQMDETNSTIADLKEAPAFILGQVKDIPQASLADFRKLASQALASLNLTEGNIDSAENQESEIGPVQNATSTDASSVQTNSNNNANSSNNLFAQAQSRYETLWTAPRRDLGDSIQKAFANVDDILSDLGEDITAENQRAVRILAYNNLEITSENIDQMRTGDALVQKTFDNLTPAVVNRMINEGINPLDLSLTQLNQVCDDLRSDVNDSESKFSKYLWKVEHTTGISEETRSAFIGVYRLIHQVEATDGAAIGQLLQQGSDVTLRNLMTAVRSSKKEGSSYTVDDSFGEIQEFNVSSLSITDQIEMAYQTRRIHEAGQTMTPTKLSRFDNEDDYMQLTPDQFSDRLNRLAEDPEVIRQETAREKEYYSEQKETIRQAAMSDQEVYELLEKNDIPVTANVLTAMQELLNDRNSVYRQLKAYAQSQSEEETGIEDLIEDLIEDFGEACKTPADMAEAEQRLEETAENVMKNMLVSDDVRTIDLKGIKMVISQIHALGQVAQRSENYTIPIMVADETGTMNLKIVHGKEENGLVDLAFSCDNSGTVTGTFRYENGQINGQLDTDDAQTRQLLAENLGLLADHLQELEMPVSINCSLSGQLDANDIFADRDYGFETTTESDSIATSTLYTVARSLIQGLGEIFSDLF